MAGAVHKSSGYALLEHGLPACMPTWANQFQPEHHLLVRPRKPAVPTPRRGFLVPHKGSWRALVCSAGLGCPHKVWDPGAAYIHGQRVAQWRNAQEDRPVPALHAPADSPIYHAHGAEIFPDSDTARYASDAYACTAVMPLCSGDVCRSVTQYAASVARLLCYRVSEARCSQAMPCQLARSSRKSSVSTQLPRLGARTHMPE